MFDHPFTLQSRLLFSDQVSEPMRRPAATDAFENIRGKISCHTYDARATFPSLLLPSPSNIRSLTMSNDNADSTKPAEPLLLEDKAANENVTRLDVDGNKVPLLDELGPMVVNSDGVSA